MKIIYKQVEDLQGYGNNNKIHSERQIKLIGESIKEYGFKQPIVIDRYDVIVAGHGRVEAAKLIGMEQLPCIVADDLTELQIRSYRIADNKLSALADWDEEALKIELEDISKVVDLGGLGFDSTDSSVLPNIIENNIDSSDTDIELIEEEDINMGYNFIIKCADITELRDLQTKLNTDVDETKQVLKVKYADLVL